MPVRSIDLLKSWFETGDKPTQAQFADLIDSLRHAGTPIPMADVEGLVLQLNALAARTELQPLLPIVGNVTGGVAASIAIPAGRLVKAVVVHTLAAAGALKVGNSLGSGDMLDTQVLTGAHEVVGVFKYYPSAGTLFIESTVNCNYEIHF